MSLETHISGSEDKLIDSLSFAGRNTASYVTERRSCSFQPQSGGLFSPNGVRLLRFNLADQSGWLVGDSVRLVMQIQNNTSNPCSRSAILRLACSEECA